VKCARVVVSWYCSDDLCMLHVSFDVDSVAEFAELYGIGMWARAGGSV
jgi:hypothetical protein